MTQSSLGQLTDQKNRNKNVLFPKICVSLIEKDPTLILRIAREMAESDVDMVEWRLDYVVNEMDIEELLRLFQKIRVILAEKELLVTLRTHLEGGSVRVSKECYRQTYLGLLKTGLVDWLDIEAKRPLEWFNEVLVEANKQHCQIIASYHNFLETPSNSYLEKLVLDFMKINPDVIKIAVMPEFEEDVWRLLHWNQQTLQCLGQIKIIAIAMGELGKISRLVGGITGSYLTFTSFSKVSAPGQLKFEEVHWLFSLAKIKLAEQGSEDNGEEKNSKN
ncbi:type I 3-dehydroquinate dehydratase [Vagococcus intermedius]|uniref:3-dehydroquinate dehydratase n=1 Tax=Vagococcus intermedius TaxID=2991418 RepID=A0AAF0CUA9_9ENTE|nr:type I 3-dehydroquinate dehydratase [Vagococcus intermedius]WEG73001.1 type I 3-dehydroquinate dehydratase [Vagococcus intermedius]WEG75087.1 type I 3-dehydroquinate dehydratase [Vagococcus intermedius]